MDKGKLSDNTILPNNKSCIFTFIAYILWSTTQMGMRGDNCPISNLSVTLNDRSKTNFYVIANNTILPI